MLGVNNRSLFILSAARSRFYTEGVLKVVFRMCLESTIAFRATEYALTRRSGGLWAFSSLKKSGVRYG